jgi:nucleotide-binding universal stress UspA family protein
MLDPFRTALGVSRAPGNSGARHEERSVNTQVSPSAVPTPEDEAPTIVVGVDGSEKNTPAVHWAAREAARRHGRLVLASACVTYAGTTAGYDGWYPYEEIVEETRSSLQQMQERLARQVPDVAVHVTTGGPLPALLAEAEAGADLLVVGQRGAGALSRVMVGSTSIAVAGRSPVPVIVVPDSWLAGQAAAGPVVVGLALRPGSTPKESAAVVKFAFERAALLQVPLLAVVAVEVPHMRAWSSEQVESWRQAHEEEAGEFLASWRDRFPDVKVAVRAEVAQPASAVLDAVEPGGEPRVVQGPGPAQMVVLGRHTGRHHFGGFTLGSTARAVLHYARVPVAVVPSPVVTEQTPAEAARLRR